MTARLAMSLLRFDGRVALITGAGGGLGREYALLLASRGAKVVVNDLGGDMHGGGKNSRAADQVVATIKARGGTAVPNYDSVEDGDKVVKTAIDNFGRLDILINNAGILRDRTLPRMSDQDWDLVHRVHLRGSFLVTRAAFPYMKKQKYGRIIMTSSPSGLYGNFGQANYSAAKMGLVGLSNTIAKEGAKYNITCNAVAPTAWSRMTQELLPPEMEDVIKVEYIAPIVTYLCHESCQDTCSTIETAGGWAGKVRLQKSAGVSLKPPFTLEDVRDNWDKICDMSKPHYHTSTADATTHLLTAITESKASDEAPAYSDSVDSFIGKTVKCPPYTYTSRDVILYALGVGASLSPDNLTELKFLYEGHEDFSVIPSYAVLPAMNSVMADVFQHGIPGLKEFSPAQSLHGEQYIELKRPLPATGTLYSEGRVTDVVDKKSGALILVDVDSKTEDGELVCTNQFAIFIIGVGGFGGKRSSPHVKSTVRLPSRAPDASLQQPTTTSQAALYRLSGDYNPLHIDPEFAKLGGFSTPILHGLCSYGIATRHILRQYCDNDVSRIKAIKARFAKPVLPGHTIQTDMWKEGNRVLFRCKVVENGDVVLNGGYIDLNEPAQTAASTAKQPPPSSRRWGSREGVASYPGHVIRKPPSSLPSGAAELQSTAIFQEMQKLVSSSPDLVKKVRAIFLWNITKGKSTVAQWTVDLKNAPGSIYPGEPVGTKPGCTLTLSDADFVGMVTGKLNAQQAFYQGKLKITGNIMLSQKLGALFTARPKL